MGRVVAAVVSVDLAEFWGVVPERRIVPVPTHGLATVYTGASLLFEPLACCVGPCGMRQARWKRCCCCGWTDVLADERKITKNYPQV